MKLSLEGDPRQTREERAARKRAYRARHPEDKERAKRTRRAWYRVDTERQRRQQEHRHAKNYDRWLAEGREREQTFHTINEARGRGLTYEQIKIPARWSSNKSGYGSAESFMLRAQETWQWGNRDGRDWAARTNKTLVNAVCQFMKGKKKFEAMLDVLADDWEFSFINPDPIYQEGWFNGVCQHAIPGYVVRSRFEQEERLIECHVCGKPFKSKTAQTCSSECFAEKERRRGERRQADPIDAARHKKATAKYRAKKRAAKPMAECVVCGTPFKYNGRVNTCSPECHKEKLRRIGRLADQRRAPQRAAHAEAA